ncbi:MAG TPA: hypothetical protein VGM10_13590 [Actinocrinis sp.]|jgi:hypothetical protein
MSSESNAQELINTAEAVTRATRRARQAYWFPLLVFGCIAVGAAPFYIAPSRPAGTVFVAGPDLTAYLGGSLPSGHSAASSLYWTLALAAGYLAVVFFYRLRALKAGVAGRIRPALVIGVGALVLLLLTGSWLSPAVSPNRFLPLEFFIRGLVPLIVIGIGVLAFAWSERSPGLLAFGLCFLAVAALSNLYELGNLAYRAGWSLSYRYASLPNLLLPAVMLLLGGAGFLLRVRLRR